MGQKIISIFAILFFLLPGVFASGAGEVAKTNDTSCWDVDGNVVEYTNNGPSATLTLVLNKKAISGETLTIESNAQNLFLRTASNPKGYVALKVTGKAAANGSIKSLLILECASPPAITFEGESSPEYSGPWKKIAKSKDDTVTLEFADASFAKVTFTPVVAVPAAGGARPAQPAAVAAIAPELLKPIKAAKVQAAINRFAEGASRPCKGCNGTGKVARDVPDGTFRFANGMRYPNTRVQNDPCTTCNGTGIERDPVKTLVAKTKAMMQSIMSLDPDDPAAQELEKDFHITVTKKVIGDQTTWNTFVTDARSTLALNNPAKDTVVVAEVKILSAERTPDGKRAFRARLAGKRHSTDTFLIVDPVVADNASEGYALMGGLIAAPTTMQTGDAPTMTVRGAFLITPDLNPNWTWWTNNQHDED